MRRRPKFVANDEPSQTNPLPKAPPVTTTITQNATSNNTTVKAKINKLRPKSTKRASSPNATNKPGFVAPPPITSSLLKPTFKAIVARAMEQQKLAQKQAATTNLNAAETGNSLNASRRGSGSSTNKTKESQNLLDVRVGK
jgi:hypothetical protein